MKMALLTHQRIECRMTGDRLHRILSVFRGLNFVKDITHPPMHAPRTKYEHDSLLRSRQYPAGFAGRKGNGVYDRVANDIASRLQNVQEKLVCIKAAM